MPTVSGIGAAGSDWLDFLALAMFLRFAYSFKSYYSSKETKEGYLMMLEYVDTVFAFAVVMLLLSLVITSFVQVVVVAGSLRHRNLIWGVTKVLERSPALRRHATEITNKALAHPAICASRRKATVIGSEELVTVLRELASDSDSTLAQDAKNSLLAAFDEAVPPESKHHASQLSEEFKKLFPAEAAKMDQVVGLFKEKSTKLAGDLDKWFDTVMNRATDRFAVHTRWWTIVFATILAIALQIDSLDLIRRLSTDSGLRASLVGMANQALERADETLLAESVAVGALEAVKGAFPEVRPFDIPTELRTRAQGSGWLNKHFEGNGSWRRCGLDTSRSSTPQRENASEIWGMKCSVCGASSRNPDSSFSRIHGPSTSSAGGNGTATFSESS